jgi:sugar O-acyltransferase (sialic acid O-acetyltransferase NeuD family)
MTSELIPARPVEFTEFPKEAIWQGIHQRIEDEVRWHAGNLALKTRDFRCTYAEMNGYANSVAARILSVAGITLGQAAVLLPNTPDLIITVLASLKAHKAYVPLDPGFPKARLQTMIRYTEPSVLLTDDQHLELAEELAGTGTHIINISQTTRDPEAPNPKVACDPLDRAYILFTSGSTGQPKGIVFLHRNLLHTTMCLTNYLSFAPSDRVTWLHSASFAASVVDIYCCLTNGGTLYPWDVKARGFIGLADLLVQEKVTTLQWIPSAFRQFLRTIPDELVFQSIRMVIMASEPLRAREVELFRQHFPVGSYLVNQVGTSESYNYRLYAMDHHSRVDAGAVPGGYAVSEAREILILDDGQRPLPVGHVGEIGVRSEFMAGGYWHNDALTSSRFVQIGADKTPVFLTGDLGRLDSNGCLFHLGRKDSQVKIRGYRVELTEIDDALATAPGLADATVAVLPNSQGEDQLVGYVILQERREFDQLAIEGHLSARLPEYMVPRHYVVLNRFPTLPTGKVDRRGLPNPFELPNVSPPSTDFGRSLKTTDVATLFEEVLQVGKIDLDTDFVQCGGDSLSTAVLLTRVYQEFGVEIEAAEFLRLATPEHLAGLIRSAAQKGRRSAPARCGVNGGSMAGGIELGSAQACTLWLPSVRCGRSANNGGSGSASRKNKNLIIICAGGFGREVFAWAADSIAAGAPWRIKGFLDARRGALDRYGYECNVIGDVDTYDIQEDDVFIGAIGNPKDKLKCYLPIIKKGGLFVNVIHPLANVGMNVKLGVGIVMAPFSSITSDISVGSHVAIGAFSNAGHDSAIGNWCQISSHCGINGNAVLGEGVFLGSHACIIPGARVGPWAFVGAGSVVLRDVPSRLKVFGNPAVPVGRVEGPDPVDRQHAASVPACDSSRVTTSRGGEAD